jgi:epoxyqueuosine reductase QueG
MGEVGRLGLLMTKKFDPRVRLACVTTDLPLIPDDPVDIGVEDFCRVCKRCVHCPSKSIPFDAPREVNGTLKWKLNAETCFEYWAKNGPDCCLCMRVCPWSHPGTLPHRLIVELIVRNQIARRIFSNLDDLLPETQARVPAEMGHE